MVGLGLLCVFCFTMLCSGWRILNSSGDTDKRSCIGLHDGGLIGPLVGYIDLRLWKLRSDIYKNYTLIGTGVSPIWGTDSLFPRYLFFFTFMYMYSQLCLSCICISQILLKKKAYRPIQLTSPLLLKINFHLFLSPISCHFSSLVITSLQMDST